MGGAGSYSATPGTPAATAGHRRAPECRISPSPGTGYACARTACLRTLRGTSSARSVEERVVGELQRQTQF